MKEKQTPLMEKRQVVMLPTNEASKLRLDKITNFFYISHDGMKSPNNYHLYVLSDEEIKEGDWCIVDRQYLRHIDKELFSVLSSSTNETEERYRKIIATTDNNLWKRYSEPKEEYVGIPPKKAIVEWPITPVSKLPTDFIQAYIKAYNEGKQIEWIMVEYEFITENESFIQRPIRIQQLKLRSDNTIIIHPVKERMFTEEAMFQSYLHGIKVGNEQSEIDFVTWLSEKYPE